ncbi:hypothetical protein P7K49_030574, partial [Saguinus oedipus]
LLSGGGHQPGALYWMNLSAWTLGTSRTLSQGIMLFSTHEELNEIPQASQACY